MLTGLMYYPRSRNNILTDYILQRNYLQFNALYKKTEGYVYQNKIDERKRTKPKFKIHEFVRTADLKKGSQRGMQLIGRLISRKITENKNDTTPSYRNDNLPARYNEALLKKTKLSEQEKKVVLRDLRLY